MKNRGALQNMPRTARSNKGFFYFIFFSFFLLLVFTIVLGSFFYHQSAKTTKDSVLSLQQIILNQGAEVIDTHLLSAKNHLINLARNPLLEEVGKLKEPLSNQDEHTKYRLTTFLGKQYNSNPAVSSFYVYYKNIDAVFTRFSKYPSDFFFESYLSPNELTAQEWKEQLHKRQFLSALPLGNQEISLAQSIPLSQNQEVQGTVVVVLNSEILHSVLAKANTFSNSTLLVVDEEGRCVGQLGERIEILPETLVQLLTNQSDLREYENYYISTYHSPVSRWQYISLVHQKEVMAHVEKQKQAFFLIIALELLVGGLLSYLISRRIYRPIHHLKNLLHLDHQGELEAPSEMTRIQNAIVALREDKETMEQRYEYVKPGYTSYLLIQLTNGIFPSPQHHKEALDTLGLTFEGTQGFYLIFRFPNKENRIWHRVALVNIIQELFNFYHTYCWRPNETDTAVLLYGKFPENFLETIKKPLDLTKKLLVEEFDATVSIGTSQVFCSEKELNLAYQQALAALHHNVLYEGKAYRTASVYSTERMEAVYVNPLGSFREVLTNQIRAGEKDQACEYIRSVYQKLMHENDIPYSLSVCYFNNLLATIIQIVSSNELNLSMPLQEKNRHIQELIASNCFAQQQNKVIEIISETLQGNQCSLLGQNDILYQNMTRVIAQELCNPNLGLALVADTLEMNASYLSNFFRTYSGESVVDYIHKERLSVAKDELLHTNNSIAVIAEQLGYSNYSTLIRSFKKYVGVTPGQFRALQHSP